MLNLFTIPAATTTIAAVSEYSSPWFTELLPVAYVAIGVVIGISFVIWLIALFQDTFFYWLRDRRFKKSMKDYNPNEY